MLYSLVLVAGYICHDVWYRERATAYIESAAELKTDSKEYGVATGFFVTELCLLTFFLIDILMHVAGFSKLYLREAKSIADLLFTLTCGALTAFMLVNGERR